MQHLQMWAYSLWMRYDIEVFEFVDWLTGCYIVFRKTQTDIENALMEKRGKKDCWHR